MKVGDLVNTIIENTPVILLKKEAKQVWLVVSSEGKVTSEWSLNLEPYKSGIV